MDSLEPEHLARLKDLPGLSCKKVLCWVGSFNEQDPVAQLAQTLANQNRGHCHVVLGLDSPYRLRAGMTGMASQTPLTPEIISRAERRLAALYGEDFRTMVLLGHPVQEVRRFARNHRSDLIVMGRQALDVEQHYGERIVEHAPCVVMIVLPPQLSKSSAPTRDGAQHTYLPQER